MYLIIIKFPFLYLIVKKEKKNIYICIIYIIYIYIYGKNFLFFRNLYRLDYIMLRVNSLNFV